MTLYLQVDETTRLTTGLIQVSRVLVSWVKNYSVLKFVKKFQPNLAWTRG